jgi:hypothetical protein
MKATVNPTETRQDQPIITKTKWLLMQMFQNLVSVRVFFETQASLVQGYNLYSTPIKKFEGCYAR